MAYEDFGDIEIAAIIVLNFDGSGTLEVSEITVNREPRLI
jgi:hypothetical protein